MSKLSAPICGICLLAAASSALALDKSIGIIAGDPTGLSFKYWTGQGFFGRNPHAIDVGAGWKFGDQTGIHIKADYVTHKYHVIPVEAGKLPLYYGLGARILTGSDSNFGLRVPIGLNYLFANDPIDAFFEIAPTMVLVPETTVDMALGLGFRYRFK